MKRVCTLSGQLSATSFANRNRYLPDPPADPLCHVWFTHEQPNYHYVHTTPQRHAQEHPQTTNTKSLSHGSVCSSHPQRYRGLSIYLPWDSRPCLGSIRGVEPGASFVHVLRKKTPASHVGPISKSNFIPVRPTMLNVESTIRFERFLSSLFRSFYLFQTLSKWN